MSDKSLNAKIVPGMDVADVMSDRLRTIAEMLRNEKAASRACDVGCDHGYVSIYLVQHGIAESCIAMDVRKGPLSGAQDNINAYGLANRITTRLSDGLKELKPGEAEMLVIAGMGGKLMMRLVEECDLKALGIRTALLQPQSDIMLFRNFLRDKGYVITDEKVILEDGKYYFPMKVTVDGSLQNTAFETAIESLGCDRKQAVRICDRYGQCNILRKDKVLKEFLIHGREVSQDILGKLNLAEHQMRRDEIQTELSDISFALQYITA